MLRRMGSLVPVSAIEPAVTTSTGIVLKGPVNDDMSIASIAPNIHALRSNIPGHIRESLTKSSVQSESSTVPASWWSPTYHLEDKYARSLGLAPYVKGQLSAYNWSVFPVPCSVASRVPGDFRIEPTAWGSKSETLLDKVLGQKITFLFCFSGEAQSTPASGVKRWLSSVDSSIPHLQIHFHLSWISRRTHMLTKLLLRGAANTFVFRGKLTKEIVTGFHLYDKSLPSILLVDGRGFVRWHAVGLPSEASLEALRRVVAQV